MKKDNSKIWRERAIAKGLCPRCGHPKSETDEGWACFTCRRIKAEWMREYYRRKNDTRTDTSEVRSITEN